MKQIFHIIKLNNIAWLVLIATAAYGLYMVKYRVLNVQREIANIKKELEQEQENLHVIEAEWAYLTRPDRLQALAQKNTNLMPVQGMQVVQLNALPFPPAPDEEQMAKAKPDSGYAPVSLQSPPVVNIPED